MCENCGLESEEPITNVHRENNTTESDLQKGITQWKPKRKEREPKTNKYQHVRIYRDVYEEVREYCKKNKITIIKFVSEVLRDATLEYSFER